jgi:hypothetical protein
VLGDPFLDLELALAGAVEGELKRRALVGRNLEVDVLAGERGGDQTDAKNDGL